MTILEYGQVIYGIEVDEKTIKAVYSAPKQPPEEVAHARHEAGLFIAFVLRWFFGRHAEHAASAFRRSW